MLWAIRIRKLREVGIDGFCSGAPGCKAEGIVSHVRESTSPTAGRSTFSRRLRNGAIQKPAFYSGVRVASNHRGQVDRQ